MKPIKRGLKKEYLLRRISIGAEKCIVRRLMFPYICVALSTNECRTRMDRKGMTGEDFGCGLIGVLTD